MIFDTVEHAGRYFALSDGLAKGLAYLQSTDFSQVADGEYELDGRNVFVRISHNDLKAENPTPEAHRDYLDIQYLIEGTEQIGVAPLSDMTEEVEARPEGDIWFYHGPVESLTLSAGRFMVFFPEDAHAPCIGRGGNRKCLVKVRL